MALQNVSFSKKITKQGENEDVVRQSNNKRLSRASILRPMNVTDSIYELDDVKFKNSFPKVKERAKNRQRGEVYAKPALSGLDIPDHLLKQH